VLHNGIVTQQPVPARSPALVGQLIVWSAALVLSVLAAIFAPEGMRFSWLAIVLVVSMFASFVRELSTHTKEGFLARVAILCTGSLIIVMIVAGVAGFIETVSY